MPGKKNQRCIINECLKSYVRPQMIQRHSARFSHKNSIITKIKSPEQERISPNGRTLNSICYPHSLVLGGVAQNPNCLL